MGHGLTYKDTIEHFTKHMGLTDEQLDWVMGRGLCQTLEWPIEVPA
jgi:hypothetical protein